MYYYVTKKNDDVLMHHGVMGMHWGIRRYQNSDGTLTAEGKQRLKTNAKFKAKVENYKKKDSLKAKGVKGIANYLTRRYMEKNPITGYAMDEKAAIEKSQRDSKVIKTIGGIAAGMFTAMAAMTVPVIATGITAYSRGKTAVDSITSSFEANREAHRLAYEESVRRMNDEWNKAVADHEAWAAKNGLR